MGRKVRPPVRQRFRPYKDTPLIPNGRCLYGSQSTTKRFVRDLAVFITLE